MHFHILDEELNLRQIVMGREETRASHSRLKTQHFDDILLTVTNELKELLGANIVSLDRTKLKVVIHSILDLFRNLHAL